MEGCYQMFYEIVKCGGFLYYFIVKYINRNRKFVKILEIIEWQLVEKEKIRIQQCCLIDTYNTNIHSCP